MHLGNFLLGIQSFQCWTGPEMIVPPMVLTVKNQEMVYNPKIVRKQHKKISFNYTCDSIKNSKKKFSKCSFVLFNKLYRENIKFGRGVRRKEIWL